MTARWLVERWSTLYLMSQMLYLFLKQRYTRHIWILNNYQQSEVCKGYNYPKLMKEIECSWFTRMITAQQGENWIGLRFDAMLMVLNQSMYSLLLTNKSIIIDIMTLVTTPFLDQRTLLFDCGIWVPCYLVRQILQVYMCTGDLLMIPGGDNIFHKINQLPSCITNWFHEYLTDF